MTSTVHCYSPVNLATLDIVCDKGIVCYQMSDEKVLRSGDKGLKWQKMTRELTRVRMKGVESLISAE